MGGGSGGSKGGGNSGKVDYPEYMKRWHWQMLGGYDSNPVSHDGVTDSDGANYGVMAEIDFLQGQTYDGPDTARTNIDARNPYKLAVPYDPTPDLNATQRQFDRFVQDVEDLDAWVDWKRFLLAGKSHWETLALQARDVADENLLSDNIIQTAVQSFEDDTEATHQRQLVELKAGLADVNAVNSSAFVVAEAVLKGMRMNAIGKFATDFKIENHRERTQFILQGTQQQQQITTELSKHLFQVLGLRQATANLQGELNRVRLVAKKEHLDRDLDLDVKSALWPLQIWEYGGNIMASIAGATTVSKGGDENQGKSMLGGAMSGAAMGAMAGSAFGPPGALIGAAVGGIGGALL